MNFLVKILVTRPSLLGPEVGRESEWQVIIWNIAGCGKESKHPPVLCLGCSAAAVTELGLPPCSIFLETSACWSA